MNEHQQIVAELRGIKWALTVGAVCAVVLVYIDFKMAASSDSYMELQKAQITGTTFRERADYLEKTEQWNELLKVALAQQKKQPQESDGFFYAGIAHVNLRHFDEAAVAFGVARALNPAQSKVIDAWLQNVEEQRAAATPQAAEPEPPTAANTALPPPAPKAKRVPPITNPERERRAK